MPATGTSAAGAPATGTSATGTFAEVLGAFLKLGLTSFGGPIAHLAYFRTEFVERRRWLDDRRYADLVALCQFLPGPASSQVGMALGLGRAGWPGLLAAWLGFTLPSAVVLILFALGMAHVQGPALTGAVQGLKVVAVAVVAQAVWGMARTLCTDRPRAGLAFLAALLTLALPSALGQVAALILVGLLGGWGLTVAPPGSAGPMGPVGASGPLRVRGAVSRRVGWVALLLFALPLVGLPLWATATGSSTLALLDGVYRAGALVFGGGHVVLPLLQATVVPSGLMSNAEFMAGYGAAQAVPGPLFSFAAYLGAQVHGPLSGWVGGLALLAVIFLPALLVLVAALPFWEALRHRAGVQRVMAGINAAVVGILAAALYDPVWTSAIHGRADLALALTAFGLLVVARVSPVWVVLLAALTGWGMTLVAA
ncbi:chromate transporter [Comamonas serinivorans]|uniref:Chromate transporter n=1 Tax=Comamonas serinivorans TaxID=1082851 RepID=A0A1Y0EQU6_9BURK|nr:chromate efflux transporter [Comamonas serinivorans]ARU05800.1 chromate transporter [Comamonas serinivorans]